jgi:DNA-binding protein H-NS
MTKSFVQLTQEIEVLQKQAEAQRKHELSGVIARIRADIATYGLNASDLGFHSSAKTPAMPSNGASPKLIAPTKSPQAGTKVPAKYRNKAGNEWTGRGMKPRWINAAMAGGATLESFLITSATSSSPLKSAKASLKATSNSSKPKLKPTKSTGKAKFKDALGNAWSGRGPMPGWLKAAVASGKTLGQLAA